MKWIRTRKDYLNEAKIRDVLFKKQASKVKSIWGEKYLDYEETIPTDNIKQGKWKLDETDKNLVLSKFFDTDMEEVFNIFAKLPDKFSEILGKSIDTSLFKGEEKNQYEIEFKDFDIKKPSIGQIVSIYDNVFRKLSVAETSATEMISRDASGRPLKDENNQMVKISKEAGDPIFSGNLTNINSFISDYNRCYPDHKVETDFNDYSITSIRNLAKEDHNGEYKVDFDIFGKDIYLSISHNPKDILNMSISKYYSSCQHLYSGGYNERVLANVFDPNSIPAFLTFETPIFWSDEKISDQLPLTRMVIRNIEEFDTNPDTKKIFFDRAYPDRMKDIFGEMIRKYSSNIDNCDTDTIRNYLWAPDINEDDDLREPYMDRLNYKRGTFIGVNTKTLYLSKIGDWSSYKISKHAKIKELIIETTDLPENLFTLDIKLDWIKFKFLTINNISNFDKIKSSAIAFDKCTFDGSIIKEMISTNPDISKIQITACDITNLDLSVIESLDELQLVFTLDKGTKLDTILNSNIKLNKLVISGDLVADPDNKKYLGSLKSKGVKIETVGPVI